MALSPRGSRPCCRPGHCHRPRAPKAIPSHPVPTMGGTTIPTTTHLSSARATAICCSTSPHTVTVPPSHQHFIICHTGAGDVVSTGGRNDFFRDCGKRLQKRSRRRPLACRVCWRHCPRAPSSLESLCGRRHRPWARSFPEAFLRGGGLSHGLRSLALALVPFVLGFSIHIPFFCFHYGFAPWNRGGVLVYRHSYPKVL